MLRLKEAAPPPPPWTDEVRLSLSMPEPMLSLSMDELSLSMPEPMLSLSMLILATYHVAALDVTIRTEPKIKTDIPRFQNCDCFCFWQILRDLGLVLVSVGQMFGTI